MNKKEVNELFKKLGSIKLCDLKITKNKNKVVVKCIKLKSIKQRKILKDM